MFHHGSHWIDFCEVFSLGASMKICIEIPDFGKIGQTYRALYLKTEVCFIVASVIKFS